MTKVLILNNDKPENFTVVSLLVGATIEEVERCLIIETLSKCAGNKTLAAKILGINSKTLRNKLVKYRAEGHLDEEINNE